MDGYEVHLYLHLVYDMQWKNDDMFPYIIVYHVQYLVSVFVCKKIKSNQINRISSITPQTYLTICSLNMNANFVINDAKRIKSDVSWNGCRGNRKNGFELINNGDGFVRYISSSQKSVDFLFFSWKKNKIKKNYSFDRNIRIKFLNMMMMTQSNSYTQNKWIYIPNRIFIVKNHIVCLVCRKKIFWTHLH